MGCVYMVTNIITHKCYIGKTIFTLAKRRKEHWSYRKQDGTYFHKALEKYGKDAFMWEVVFQSDNEVELYEQECFFINKYNTLIPNGYNMTLGGEGVSGVTFSDEWYIKNKKRSEELGRAVYCLETATIYKSRAEAAHLLNLNYPSVGLCVSGKNRHCNHYHFCAPDEESIKALRERCAIVKDNSKRPHTEEEKLMASRQHKGRKKPTSYSEKLSVRMKKKFAEMPEAELKAKMSRMSKGKKVGKDNPSARAVIIEKTGEHFDTISEAVEKCNLPSKAGSNISSCCSGKLKSAYGFHWKYAEEYSVAI